MKKRIYIRVDGSAEIGLGHLVRCMALAYMLKHDFEIVFVNKEAPSQIQEEIERDFKLIVIKNEEDFLQLLLPENIVVLDNYFFDTIYQKEIKNIGCKLVCIDDVHDREFYADLIINHAPGITKEVYHAQTYTKFALGLDYVLLRPAFLEQAKKKRLVTEINSVLICFGGSDLKDLTTLCLKLILEKQFKEINIIVGVAYSNNNDLERIVKTDTRVKLHRGINQDEVLDIMSISDLAIVPASGVLFETLACGCKVISGYYADNQKEIYNSFVSEGVVVAAACFDEEELESAIDSVMFAKQSIGLIDGNSSKRLLNIFRRYFLDEVFLVKAEESDMEQAYLWANDSEIRKYFFSQKSIDKEKHKLWFDEKIKDSTCLYYMVYHKENLVGSLRYDIEGDEAVISYLVDKSFQGKGFGKQMVKKGEEFLLEKGLKKIFAIVKKENIPSIRVFERLGYTGTIKKDTIEFRKKLGIEL